MAFVTLILGFLAGYGIAVSRKPAPPLPVNRPAIVEELRAIPTVFRLGTYGTSPVDPVGLNDLLRRAADALECPTEPEGEI